MNTVKDHAPGKGSDAKKESSDQPFVICEGLVRIYKSLDLEVMALQGLDLTVNQGEIMAIIGSSGSGKSTLLNILGALDRPSAGKAIVGGWNLARIRSEERTIYQRDTVGFVWQNIGRNLVPYLTARENTELPMLIHGGIPPHERRKRAEELLEIAGLAHRSNHLPSEMSGGQQQRIAIAIGLANRPKLLLADEPTGALDSKTSRCILELFREVRDRFGTTVIIVTHDRQIANEVDRFVQIRDGRISTETVRRTHRNRAFSDDEKTHDEYAVLDSAGRIQIPSAFLEKLKITTHARIALGKDRIVIKSRKEKDPRGRVN